MTTIRGFISRRPVLSYFVLTFAISWGGVLLVVGGPGALPIAPEQTTELFPPIYLATVAGPGLASILLTGLISGKAGFRELGSCLIKWRVGLRWYAVAVLTTPLTVMGTLLGLSLVSPEFLPGALTTGDDASLAGAITQQFGLLVGIALLTGFLEELGWTGFAIPRVRLRYSVFMTGLLVGLLWGAWHFVSNVLMSDTSWGALFLALYMAVLLFSFLPPYRVLMVWVYDNTGSLLVAMLMHASLVMFWLVATPRGITSVPQMIWYVAWAAVLWLVVGVVAAVRGRRPSPHPLRTQVA
jgi:membrane protease YdiL (CAAX protease family)